MNTHEIELEKLKKVFKGFSWERNGNTTGKDGYYDSYEYVLIFQRDNEKTFNFKFILYEYDKLFTEKFIIFIQSGIRNYIKFILR